MAEPQINMEAGKAALEEVSPKPPTVIQFFLG